MLGGGERSWTFKWGRAPPRSVPDLGTPSCPGGSPPTWPCRWRGTHRQPTREGQPGPPLHHGPPSVPSTALRWASRALRHLPPPRMWVRQSCALRVVEGGLLWGPHLGVMGAHGRVASRQGCDGILVLGGVCAAPVWVSPGPRLGGGRRHSPRLQHEQGQAMEKTLLDEKQSPDPRQLLSSSWPSPPSRGAG